MYLSYSFSKTSFGKFIYTHKYLLAVCVITCIAIFFRFYNYPNRWGLGSDQARDAIIVRRALLTHSFPLIGPFSASGPFVFAPSWYLLFMFLTAIAPGFLLTPWIMQSILFVGSVLLMIQIGKTIGGKTLALIVGILTAVSPAQIDASTNLIFSSLENVISTIVLFCFVYTLKKRTTVAYFFLSFSIGLAITVHFQAVPLLILFPSIIIVTKPRLKKIMWMLLGLCIPFIPLLVFDIRTNFYESRNIFTYFFLTNSSKQSDQRWLTYLFSFWPTIWADMVGGFPVIGVLSIGSLFFISLCTIAKRRTSLVFILGLVSFFIIFVFLRYFEGQLFENFLSFLQPFILLVSGYACFKIIQIQKYLGYCLLSILILGSTIVSFQHITQATNQTATETYILQSFLEQAYPHQKLAIYDYQYKTTSLSIPLALFIYSKNENKATGKRFGIATEQLRNMHIVDDISEPYKVYVYDLNTLSPAELQKQNWILVNPLAIYASVEDWYKK